MRRTVRASGAVNATPAQNTLQGTATWSPTVANLMVAVILEIVIFAVIRVVFIKMTK